MLRIHSLCNTKYPKNKISYFPRGSTKTNKWQSSSAFHSLFAYYSLSESFRPAALCPGRSASVYPLVYPLMGQCAPWTLSPSATTKIEQTWVTPQERWTKTENFLLSLQCVYLPERQQCRFCSGSLMFSPSPLCQQFVLPLCSCNRKMYFPVFIAQLKLDS